MSAEGMAGKKKKKIRWSKKRRFITTHCQDLQPFLRENEWSEEMGVELKWENVIFSGSL